MVVKIFMNRETSQFNFCSVIVEVFKYQMTNIIGGGYEIEAICEA